MKEILGLEEYTYDEILEIIDNYVQYIIANDLNNDIEFVDSMLHGSRLRGNAKNDSDLDYVFEYIGDYKEDSIFNIMHDEPYYIEGIEVDINPIRKLESGDLESYAKKSYQYDKEQLNSINEKLYIDYVNLLNESKLLLILINQLNSDQLMAFKKWLIDNNSDEKQQMKFITNILSIKDQLIISDDDYINKEEDLIKQQKIEELKKDQKFTDLILWAENTERIQKYIDVIVATLVKKAKKGLDLDVDILALSAMMDKIVRETIKTYEYELQIKVHISSELRKLVKHQLAENILETVEDEL